MLTSHAPIQTYPSLADLPVTAPPHASPAPAGEVDSRHLLKGRREVLIRHGEEHYRLRHTRNNKLILTK